MEINEDKIPVERPGRFNFNNEIPFNESFGTGKRCELFDIIIHQLFFSEGKNNQEISYRYKENFLASKYTFEKESQNQSSLKKKFQGKRMGFSGDELKQKAETMKARRQSPILLPGIPSRPSAKPTRPKSKNRKSIANRLNKAHANTITLPIIQNKDIVYDIQENPKIKNLIDVLDSCVHSDSISSGLDDKQFNQLWKLLDDPENTTATVTLLLARLLKIEIDFFRLRLKSDNHYYRGVLQQKDGEEKETEAPRRSSILQSKFQELINYFDLDKINPKLVTSLLDERKEAMFHLKNGERLDTPSCGFGSFLQNGFELTKRSFIQSKGTIIDENKERHVIGKKEAKKGQEDKMEDKDFPSHIIIERSAILSLLGYLVSFHPIYIEEKGLLKVLIEWKNFKKGESKLYKIKKDDRLVEVDYSDLVDPLFKLLESQTIEYFDLLDTQTVLFPQGSPYDANNFWDSFAFLKLKSLAEIDPSRLIILFDTLLCKIEEKYKGKEKGNKKKRELSATLIKVFKFIKFFFQQIAFTLECHEDLKHLREHIQLYFLQPLPLGKEAYDLMQLIDKEMHFSGHNFRTFFDLSLSPNKLTPRTVHVLYNEHASYSSFLNKFNLNVPDADIVNRIIETKANLVLNIFADFLNNGKDAPKYKSLHFKSLAHFYPEISTFLEEESQKIPYSNDSLIMKKKLLDFYTRIETFNKKKNDEFEAEGTVFKRRRVPPLPRVRIKLIELEEEETLSQDATKNIMATIPHTIYLDRLKSIVKKAQNQNIDMIYKNQNSPKRTKKGSFHATSPNPIERSFKKKCLPVDIAIAGGSGSIQRLAHAIVGYRSLKDCDQDVEFRLFLLPFGKNNYLAEWFSNYDSFYGKYLYYPTINRIGVFPTYKVPLKKLPESLNKEGLGVKTQNKLWSKAPVNKGHRANEFFKKRNVEHGDTDNFEACKDVVSSKDFMNYLLHHYFVASLKASLSVSIFTVQCLTYSKKGFRKTTKKTEMTSLSFCQRLEIGFFPELINFRKKKGLELFPASTILNEKGFKYQPQTLTVSYVPRGNGGAYYKEKKTVLPNKVFSRIQLKNVSLEGDVGEITFPNRQFLQVYVEDGKTYSESFRAAVVSVESTKPFSVLLDGEVFGPFHQLYINKFKEGFNFSLQSFK